MVYINTGTIRRLFMVDVFNDEKWNIGMMEKWNLKGTLTSIFHFI